MRPASSNASRSSSVGESAASVSYPPLALSSAASMTFTTASGPFSTRAFLRAVSAAVSVYAPGSAPSSRRRFSHLCGVLHFLRRHAQKDVPPLRVLLLLSGRRIREGAGLLVPPRLAKLVDESIPVGHTASPPSQKLKRATPARISPVPAHAMGGIFSRKTTSPPTTCTPMAVSPSVSG